jgi:hypothetical protein
MPVLEAEVEEAWDTAVWQNDGFKKICCVIVTLHLEKRVMCMQDYGSRRFHVSLVTYN